ncbi:MULTISPECIES: vWA domain-containing protein [Paenibacillus]|uniref:vWA domain-containing protein n=1 Tax=Paenibacillus TaxID=44249 RepID=UPI0004032725|nr:MULTISPECIES: vWA domain-containing protein [Paenibacillus]KGP79478.1 von Willebrand factor A [Paenibacillus sp. MAEPY2]KGP87915.1 von Willebrand factor A [Paenibacillus sp. MAEPY1]OZQ70399.1 VWA domain-containing protein [Paenibacillus taichungensis]HBU81061.1 VWA domain-containing protein [Paenibacillus sp.]
MLRTSKIRWLSGTLVLLAILTLLLPQALLPHAAAAQAQTSGIDAVLVADVSNSMNTSDRDKISNEAMKMFIDMLPVQGDKVGIVAYTDQVEREKALLEIQSDADKNSLKDFIDQLGRGPYTDISVGVAEAVNVLNHGADKSHSPMIVLLADGNNDFNKTKGRTQAQSDADLAKAVKEAKDQGIPVYTIGLNADGKLNKDALADLSQQTGGKSFITDTPDDLPQILSEIFADHAKLNVVKLPSITGNGSYQEVTVNVPNDSVLEANISIMSSKQVQIELTDPSGKAVDLNSNAAKLSTSKSYSLVKLLKPQEGDWKLRVKGAPKDSIDINLLFNYDLQLVVDPIKTKSYTKGDKVDLTAKLENGGQPLQDNDLYADMKATLVVNDLDTGKSVEQPLENTGTGFAGTFEVPDNHNYELVIRAEEDSFYRESAPITINAGGAAGSGNQPTTSAGEQDKPFPWLPVILGVIALVVVAVGGWFLMGWLKRKNRGFVGQMVIEIRDENTGDKSYPQYKKLASFRGRFHLHQLLQLDPELKETEKYVFTPSNGDRIIIRNTAGGTLEKSGRAVDASSGVELKNGDRLSIPLQQADKTILIEYLV